MNSNFIVLIPSYQPEAVLLELVEKLIKNDFMKIIIVDDGSCQCKKSDEYKAIFDRAEAAGAFLLHHEKNQGKGQALKTGFNYIVKNFPDCLGVITVDCDGQHLCEDVLKISQALNANPQKVIIGVRDLKDKKSPLTSRIGNRLAAAFFRFSTGKKCSDTQSGLRGIPKSLFKLACEDEGSRYEYETNFLSDSVIKTGLVEVPVTGIFFTNGNYSHYKPLTDTFRLYGRFLKFCTSSFIAFIVDFFVFLELNAWLERYGIKSVRVIFIATAMARFISSIVAYLINALWSFKGRGKTKKKCYQFIKFFLLWAFIVLVNSCLVFLLQKLFLPLALAKLIANVITFFVNYLGQHNWVFVEKKKQI